MSCPEMEYQYRPLKREQDEIRLVLLLPGGRDDPIQISIHHAPLPVPPNNQSQHIDCAELEKSVPYPWSVEETAEGDILYLNTVSKQTSWTHPAGKPSQSPLRRSEFEPRYEALSYTWGTMREPETAYVVDSTNSRSAMERTFLSIGQNLAGALRHLRYIDRVRVLWVDAVCINQKDVPECNEQVKRMASIYKLASRVVAWLGEETHDSALAIATLQHIGDQLAATISGSLVRAPEALQHDLWMNAYCPVYDQRIWQALAALLERTWFYRLWCWQEIGLGSHQHTVVQCGTQQIRWAVFWRAVLCLHNKERLPTITFRERCRHVAYLTHDAHNTHTSVLLDLARAKGCAEPRDKVYGLLGLMGPGFVARVRADYALSVERVYRDAFLAHAEVTQRLELLKHCNLRKKTTNGASWIPDWSVTEFAAPFISEQFSTGISRAYFEFVEPDVLEVVGICCTAVRTVSKAASDDIDTALRIVPAWLEGLTRADRYVNGQTIIEAFAMTLCMNRTRERQPNNHMLSVFEWVDMVQSIVSLNGDSSNPALQSDREIANTIQKVRGRSFFSTEDGHIGTAPAGVQPGKRSTCLSFSFSTQF